MPPSVPASRGRLFEGRTSAGGDRIWRGPAGRADMSPEPSRPALTSGDNAYMPSSKPVNWQPISQMPFVGGMIDDALRDTCGHVQTLTEGRAKPHVLDDATIDRVERVHLEQLEFIDIYAEQIQRWRTPGPSAVQTLELDRLETQNRRLPQVTTDVLALAHELRKGTIDRIMAMSDLELGRQALREIPPPRRS
jgi:hypothetical protein